MTVRRLLHLMAVPVLAVALALTVAAPVGAAPRTAAAGAGALTTPVTGVVNGVAQTGTLTITKFTHQGRQIFANGALNLGDATTPVQVPLVRQDPACPILNLVLGPLDLNLLGLVVHLNQVVLNITAQSGPGNLLGNLLCAVAGLLNGTAPATGLLTSLLNQILAGL